MKHKFYITDLHKGEIVGTDNQEIAFELSHSDDHFVIAAETGMKIICGNVEECKSIQIN